MSFAIRGVRENGGVVWFTGRAGEGFVSEERGEAFESFSLEGARRRAMSLNAMTAVHGIHFMVPVPNEHDAVLTAIGGL